jgi:GAF domain-containing protein
MMYPSSEVDLLCARLNSGDITRQRFVEECVRLTSRQIACSRAGLWVFVDSPGGRLLRCEGVYDRINDRVVQVADESEERSGPYFRELERSGHVLANDARTHPATRSFFEDHLQSTGVRSLMAAAFSLNGRLFGAFTCTQVAEPMAWSQRQLAMLTKIGSRATLALASSPRFLDSMLAPL